MKIIHFFQATSCIQILFFCDVEISIALFPGKSEEHLEAEPGGNSPSCSLQRKHCECLQHLWSQVFPDLIARIDYVGRPVRLSKNLHIFEAFRLVAFFWCGSTPCFDIGLSALKICINNIAFYKSSQNFHEECVNSQRLQCFNIHRQ